MQLLISNEQRDAPVPSALRSLLRRALEEVLATEEVGSGRVPARRVGAEVGMEGIGGERPRGTHPVDGSGTRRAPANNNQTTGDRRPATGKVEVSMVLVDDTRMAALNKQYRGITGTTDVLAFPMLSDEAGEQENRPPVHPPVQPIEFLLGDIVISAPQAIRQAESYGNTLQQELVLLAVHGMLHLLGYDDQDASGADRMQERARQVMDRLGLGVVDRLGADADG